MTTAIISPRNNDLDPISESDRAQAAALGQLDREEGRRPGARHAQVQGIPLHDRDKEDMLFRIILYNNFVIVSNPFFQITSRFHSLSEYVKRSATLPHVRLIWARSNKLRE